MQGSFPIARVGGIQIRLHYTFLLVLPIIAYAFARTFVNFRNAAEMAGIPPELIKGSPLFWGTMLALALFASVLVHELAHALFAIRKGGKVRDITLLMIGGVTNVAEPPRGPKNEALMALVGPLTSLALAGILYASYLLFRGTTLYSCRFVLFYLAGMNLALGLFNLLPAFPMDGGRVLRGLLATRIGTVRATHYAATLGKGFALVFVLVAFVTLNFLLMMVAFFVYIGAQAEDAQVVAQSVLGEVRVVDLVRPRPVSIDAAATVDQALAQMIADRELALLVRRGPDLLGVISLDDIEKVPPEQRMILSVAEIARPAPAVSASANLWDALRLMRDNNLPLVPVTDGSQLIGSLSQEDVLRGLRLFQLQRRPRGGRMIPRARLP